MIVDFRSHRNIGGGVYADIFGDRAFKLFKSGPAVPPRQTAQGRRRVFECQCEAFRVANSDSWLSGHVAAFYGVAILEDVIGVDGGSLRDTYLLDCCYSIELFCSDDID